MGKVPIPEGESLDLLTGVLQVQRYVPAGGLGPQEYIHLFLLHNGRMNELVPGDKGIDLVELLMELLKGLRIEKDFM